MAKPAGRKAKAAPQADPTARALAMARELLQSGGSQSLRPVRQAEGSGSSRCSRT